MAEILPEIVEINDMYVRFGFTLPGAAQLTGGQRMDDLTELSLLSDTEVESLCKLVRNPGGTAAGIGRAPPQPNRGLAISMKAITNLKLGCYYVRHMIRTSRFSNAPSSLYRGSGVFFHLGQPRRHMSSRRIKLRLMIVTGRRRWNLWFSGFLPTKG